MDSNEDQVSLEMDEVEKNKRTDFIKNLGKPEYETRQLIEKAINNLDSYFITSGKYKGHIAKDVGNMYLGQYIVKAEFIPFWVLDEYKRRTASGKYSSFLMDEEVQARIKNIKDGNETYVNF